ncbi:hypothetical protein SDRG_16852 [Saprolegnia diclina VS20]|uniref:F-box domain-containing protein n=1 Tax=Saprolegnia diclina (strain VS20) TaxID=1156394 RepID=T0R700_SAPDV|nr:hypothetical protein SDRG_16852 [Saprolegnia diclina VS20]EQC25272.1 hypothetical protein SDRG_16852 [Saprolegnia diclina VS20]|eukprot:XP_008621297.1 hypothetical protein SDRG_16852 [Saprolegnia diclina VS20]
MAQEPCLLPEALDNIARFINDRHTLQAFFAAVPMPEPAALHDLVTNPDASIFVMDRPTIVLYSAPELASTVARLYALLSLRPSLLVVVNSGTNLDYLGPLLPKVTAMTVEMHTATPTDETTWVRAIVRRCPHPNELHVHLAVRHKLVAPRLPLLAFPALRFLTLRTRVPLDGASIATIHAWLERGTAVGLSLDDVHFREADARALCDALHACHSLVELHLIDVAYLTLAMLGARPLPSTLRVFTYNRLYVRATPSPLLTALRSANQLHTLDLSGGGHVIPGAIAELLPHFPHLRTLDLSGHKFEPQDDILHLITAMAKVRSLEQIMLRRCDLPNEAISALIECIPAWTSLRRLDLAGVRRIRAPQLQTMLSVLLGCPHFAILGLRFPLFTDATWRNIVPALGAGLLHWRRLVFSECQPTAVQVLQLLRRLLEHNQEPFSVTCGKGYSEYALQAAYSGLLHELGPLQPPIQASPCVIAIEKV